MKVSSREQLKIQATLYPWILLNLLREQQQSPWHFITSGKGLPTRGVFSIVDESDSVVFWDPESSGIQMLTRNSFDSLIVKSSIGFRFSTNSDSVAFFEDGKPKLTSFRGLSHVIEWVKLLKWLLSIQSDLGTKGWQHSNQEKLLRKVMLTFSAAIFGLNGLANLDPFSEKLLHHLPDGVIRIHIGGIGENLGTIQCLDGRLFWLRNGNSPVGREVEFRFRNLETAWKCAANLTDNLAAVGKGDIFLRGYIPLADGFNHMLDRLQMFVKAS